MTDQPEINKENLLRENEDFALVPLDNDPDGWGVRFLNGPFVETVVQYGTVTFDGKEGCMKFNYDIISSPDPELTTENLKLVQHATKVLCAVIVDNYENEALKVTEES